jgi:hypothetical protein
MGAPEQNSDSAMADKQTDTEPPNKDQHGAVPAILPPLSHCASWSRRTAGTATPSAAAAADVSAWCRRASDEQKRASIQGRLDWAQRS